LVRARRPVLSAATTNLEGSVAFYAKLFGHGHGHGHGGGRHRAGRRRGLLLTGQAVSAG
jgi:hypothetical protein